MSASGAWGFHPCHPPCLLLYHACPQSGEFWWLSGVQPPAVCVITLTFLDVTFVLVVTAFATVPTGDGTPEMILMGHCFPIFSLLLSLQLQHTTTAMVAVRGMTGSSLVIDRLTAEELGCTGLGFNLTHGTQVTPPFTTILVGVSEILSPFPFATFRGRGGTSTQVSLQEFFDMGVILPLKGQFDEQVHKVIVVWVRLFLSELVRQSSHVHVEILLTSHRWGFVGPKEPTFIRENRYSRSHTYSETPVAGGNSGSMESSSICVRTLRSVS